MLNTYPTEPSYRRHLEYNSFRTHLKYKPQDHLKVNKIYIMSLFKHVIKHCFVKKIIGVARESMNMVTPAMQLASKVPDLTVQVWAAAILKVDSEMR